MEETVEPKGPTSQPDAPIDTEHARFWGEPAEDRQLEFEDK